MAAYTELRELMSDTNLKNRVSVACIVAAEAIRSEDVGTGNHANRLIWAKKAFANPSGIATEMMMALLAANKSAPVANIVGATDDAIQTAVNAAINVFADGS